MFLRIIVNQFLSVVEQVKPGITIHANQLTFWKGELVGYNPRAGFQHMRGEMKGRAIGTDFAGNTTHAAAIEDLISELEKEMIQAASRLEFERAASLRDRIDELRESMAAKETE